MKFRLFKKIGDVSINAASVTLYVGMPKTNLALHLSFVNREILLFDGLTNSTYI